MRPPTFISNPPNLILGSGQAFGGGGTMGASDKGYQGGGRDKEGNVSGTAPGAAAASMKPSPRRLARGGRQCARFAW